MVTVSLTSQTELDRAFITWYKVTDIIRVQTLSGTSVAAPFGTQQTHGTKLTPAIASRLLPDLYSKQSTWSFPGPAQLFIACMHAVRKSWAGPGNEATWDAL